MFGYGLLVYSECMTYNVSPFPPCPCQLYLNRIMLSAFPHIVVADVIWPEGPENLLKAVVDKSLQFVSDDGGGPAGWRSVQQ